MSFDYGLLLIQKSFIPLPREVTRSPRKGVRFFICLYRAVLDLEVESGEEFRLAGLSAVKEFSRFEIFKIFMIEKYLNRECG